jgi:hypothetical protein
MSMKLSHPLSSGGAIQQDFADSVRFVHFQTEIEDFQYATDGGTAFLVNYGGVVYALTCWHVLSGYSVGTLVTTDQKNARKGSRVAQVKGVYRPTPVDDKHTDTALFDVCVVRFIQDVDPDFFGGSAYIIDPNTIAPSQIGHRLLVCGALKEKCSIVPPNIYVGFGELQFGDQGEASFDMTMRHGVALYLNAQFDSITGMSGSPVFDETANALCGMVVRGGINGANCNIYFIDIRYMIRFLDQIHTESLQERP